MSSTKLSNEPSYRMELKKFGKNFRTINIRKAKEVNCMADPQILVPVC